MSKRISAVLMMAGAGLLTGQSDSPLPKWEVVSIKRCAPGGRGGVFGQPEPGRITVTCESVVGLIRYAYILFANGRMNVLPETIVPMQKSPAWIDSDLYTIQGKAESKPGHPAADQGQMLGPMMQALLEDRFGVKVHRELRPAPVYALSAGKDGPKLQRAQPGGCTVQDLDHPFTPPAPGLALLPFCGMARVLNNGMDLRGATMAQLSAALSSRADRRVIDKTGVTGVFDIRLDWSRGDSPSGSAPPPAPPRPGEPPPPAHDPSEMTADIQDALKTLGLRLDPTQGPEEFLIVDHIKRPSEN